MKRLFSLLAVLIVLTFGPLAQAQEPLEKMTFFKTKQECVAAFKSGEFRYYVPAPEHLKAPPTLAKGTPWPGCAHEVVRESKAGSPAWVVWAENTPSLFNDNGLPSQDGRCHNKVDEFVPIIPESISDAMQKQIASLDLSKFKGDTGLQGPMGPQGPAGNDGKNFTPKGNSHKKAWLIAGGVAAVVGGWLVYDHQHNKDILGARNGPVRDNKCIATGVPTNCK